MLINFRTLRVAVLCSKRAPGLDALLRHPQRGSMFEIACVVTTESYFPEQHRIEASGVPVLVHPIKRFFDDRGASLKDARVRSEYYGVLAEMLGYLDIDTVLLLGHLYIVADSLLMRFPDQVINLHDSDLTVKTADGERKFTGLHSTRDAIVAGARETRSSIHLVTSQVDAGPVLMLSDPHPVAPFAAEAVAAGAVDIVKAYAYAQREWMMRRDWGNLAARALEYMSAGVLDEAVAGA
jgi:folate-dependent phosphoribosylglycinamide formyltransferase PurN